jgi:WD40 repeat protein
VWSIAIDPTGTVVATGDREGALRVGPANGDEPYLLLGHEGRIWDVEFDPLGRWIATGGEDGTVRIWPMPDLSKPPLHTLPHDELMAKLKSLTNLRVVRDDESPAGWTLTHEPFPGWETVPTW